MSQYGLYYKGNLLMKFAAGAGIDGLLLVNVCGIHHINLTTLEILMSCPVEDVRVECDGKAIELHLERTYSVDDIVSAAYRVQSDL